MAVRAGQTTSTHTLALPSGELEVVVRRRRGARPRFRIGLFGPAELVVPLGASKQRIEQLLESQRAWFESQLAARPEARLGLDSPDSVIIEGERRPLYWSPGAKPGVRASGPGLIVGGPKADAERALERWLRERARVRITERARIEGARLGLRFERLRIANQRSRWGSCSTSGTLSFNWRLIVAPPFALDYVVIHELCHIRHPNHSRQFWADVERALPGWRLGHEWLREHEAELISWPGPALATR